MAHFKYHQNPARLNQKSAPHLPSENQRGSQPNPRPTCPDKSATPGLEFVRSNFGLICAKLGDVGCAGVDAAVGGGASAGAGESPSDINARLKQKYPACEGDLCSSLGTNGMEPETSYLFATLQNLVEGWC